MDKIGSSTKRALISKANSRMVVIIGTAAFVVVFSLVASKALLGQATYQNKVISKKKQALTQLKADLNARDSLVNSYEAFVGTSQNVLGGNPNGTGDQDGDNARLVLDSLPSKYDFPALATTLEKVISSQNLQILGITGTDDEVAQRGNQTSSKPQPIPMPFQIQVSGSYQSIQTLVNLFEHSIRPFKMQSIEMSGSESKMSATIAAETYYQPEKNLNITTEVVK